MPTPRVPPIALATAMWLSLAAAIASADIPTSPPRVKLAVPTPSPVASAPARLDRVTAPAGATKAFDFDSFRRERLTALGHGKTRTFSGTQRAARPSSRQDVVVAKKIDTPNALSCSRLPLQIQRITGDVTPGGVLTISGGCFGSAGNVLLKGTFREGAALDLEVQSWSATSITARIPEGIWGAQDQPAELRLRSQRATYTSPLVESSPVQLHFVAARETIEVANTVVNTSCAQGEGPKGHDIPYNQAPDSCYSPPDGVVCGPSFTRHRCSVGFHFRGSPGTGADRWSVRLRRGWHLEGIDLVYQDESQFATSTEGVNIDPAADPANVGWTVNWRTSHANQYGYNTAKPYVLFTYDDGSYLMRVTVTGPRGTWS